MREMAGMDNINEQLQRYLKLAQEKLDKVLVGALGLILAIIALLWFAESRAVPRTPPEPQPVDPKAAITQEKDRFMMLQVMGKPLPSFEETDYRSLVDFNMFDPKASLDNEEREKEAQKLVNQAEQLIEASRLEEARGVLNRALRLQLAYPPAMRLLEGLDAKVEPPASPAPGRP